MDINHKNPEIKLRIDMCIVGNRFEGQVYLWT